MNGVADWSLLFAADKRVIKGEAYSFGICAGSRNPFDIEVTISSTVTITYISARHLPPRSHQANMASTLQPPLAASAESV